MWCGRFDKMMLPVIYGQKRKIGLMADGGRAWALNDSVSDENPKDEGGAHPAPQGPTGAGGVAGRWKDHTESRNVISQLCYTILLVYWII